MSDLRSSLERLRDRFEPAPGAFVRISDRHRRKHLHQRLGAIGLALVLAVGSFVFLDQAFRGAGKSPVPVSSPSPSVSPPRGPAQNGLIAFGCGYQICTMAPDGSGVAELLAAYDKTLVVAAYQPAWNSGGTRIAFTGYGHEGSSSGGGANYDLYVMNADGSELQNLTTSPDDVAKGASQGPPVWSPDGTMLAFEGDDGKDDGVYVMNADGSGFRWLAAGGWPQWSPDGSRILYTMGVPHGSDLFTIATDGTGVVQLTDAPGWDQQPEWSPDGSQIAFERSDGGVNSVFVMDADGSNQRRVFREDGVYPTQPLWSPDGTQLLFDAETRTADGNYDLYVVNADGSGSTDLTPTTDRAENWPVWSPDASMIAFRATSQLSVDTGDYQIFTMRRDGSHEERLTTDQSGYSLAWQAVPGGP
jgi:Tol biopolymer transport system component